MRSVITSAITFFMFGSISLFYPEIFLNPGQLSDEHKDIHNDCLSCHSIIGAGLNEKCISCHPTDEITTKNVSFHNVLTEYDCMSCHTGHYPVNGKYSKAFTHELLQAEIVNNCISCHKNKPVDNIHNIITTECITCHITTGWETENFDHKLITAEKLICTDCHTAEKPNDEIHNLSAGDCSGCHGTNKWKPADFEHSKYFVFDKDHPADCMKCHPANFKTYTCYECHEHTIANIRREHIKEGITDYENCAECHRSADEHGDGGGHDDEEDDDD